MPAFIKKIFGGQQDKNLDSCCGAVSVTPEDETTPENETEQQVDARSTEPATNR